MSSSTPDASFDKTTAAVLTVSDSCSRGKKRGGKKDLSGPAVAEALERHNFRVVLRSVVADERTEIQEKLIELCRSARLVVTTGGTGIAPRDVTPEATVAVCERLVEGIAEQMRIAGNAQDTLRGAESRGLRGPRNQPDPEPAGQPGGGGRVAGGGDGFAAACAGVDCGTDGARQSLVVGQCLVDRSPQFARAGLPTTNDQRPDDLSRVNWSHLLEQDQTFCPRLRRLDQARSGASRPLGHACVCGGGWLVHGPAAGSDFRGLRLPRSLALPAVCAAGFGRVGARKHRSLCHRVYGWRGAVAQAAFAQSASRRFTNPSITMNSGR